MGCSAGDGAERRMYVAGTWVPAEGGRTYRIRNPATGESLADVPFGSVRDVDASASQAAEACRAWGRRDELRNTWTSF